MKKLFATFLMAGGLQAAMAYDYPYMVFQTTDGSTIAIATEGLSITFADGQLTATSGNDSQTISLAQLSKMYFSGDNITDIQTVELATADDLDEATEIYDLQGRMVKGQRSTPSYSSLGGEYPSLGGDRGGLMLNGIYIVKSKKGIRKVYIK